jgi:hypothetical protein
VTLEIILRDSLGVILRVLFVPVAVFQPVVQAGRVHPVGSACTVRSRLDLYRDALADFELIHAGPEGRDGTHIFVPRRPVLVERQAALDHCWGAVFHDLEVGRADGDGVDPHQDFRPSGYGNRLLHQFLFVRVAQHPGAHDLIDRHRGEVLTFGGKASLTLLALQSNGVHACTIFSYNTIMVMVVELCHI